MKQLPRAKTAAFQPGGFPDQVNQSKVCVGAGHQVYEYMGLVSYRFDAQIMQMSYQSEDQ